MKRLPLLICSSLAHVASANTGVVSSLRYEGEKEIEVEEKHQADSLTLLLAIFLLILIVLTIWIFKVRRFRVLHETGFSLIYGILVGLIIKYSSSGKAVEPLECNITEESAPRNVYLRIDNGTYSYKLKRKLFTDSTGGVYESTLLFDPETFFFVLLPPIIFFAGYDMRRKYFFRNIGAILIYAFAGTTISCFVIGCMMYGYTKANLETLPAGVDNLVECLLFGALISATDPVTVLAIFHDLHVNVDLFALVFGESVMNDAVAIVLYRSVSEYSPSNAAAGGFEAAALFRSIGIFIGVFVGSFVIGCVMGLITAMFTKLTKIREFPLMETGFFTLMSYASYLCAEAAELTGIVAVLFCGITQAHYTFFNLSEESRVRTKQVFELLNFLAENFVFVYMGLALFTFPYHQWKFGFIIFSFVAITAGRLLNIVPLTFIANLRRKKKIPVKFQKTLIFAGLRGAIAFALAMRNTGSEIRQLFLTTTLVIVFITVFFNGGTTTLALEKLKIEVGVQDEPDEEDRVPDGHAAEEDELGLIATRNANRAPPTGVILIWRNFDRKYVRPIFTRRGPPLTEVFPHRLHWLARLLTPAKPVATESPAEGEEEEAEPLTGPAQLSFHDDDSNLDADIGEGQEMVQMLPYSSETAA